MKNFQQYRLTVIDILHYPDDKIVEIIADAEILFNAEHAREMLDLVARLEPPVQGVLVNRKHSYSMSFEAQRMIGAYKGVKAVAILTYSRMAKLAAKFASAKFFKIRIFSDREEALKWLQVMLKT